MRFFCNKDNLSADIEEILRAFGGEMLDKDDGKSVEVEIEFIGEKQAEILLKYSDEKIMSEILMKTALIWKTISTRSN